MELRRKHHEVAERDVEVAEGRRARQTVMRLARNIEDQFRAGRFSAVRRRDDHLAVMLRLGIMRPDRIIRQQHDSAAVPYCGKRRVQRGKRRRGACAVRAVAAVRCIEVDRLFRRGGNRPCRKQQQQSGKADRKATFCPFHHACIPSFRVKTGRPRGRMRRKGQMSGRFLLSFSIANPACVLQ